MKIFATYVLISFLAIAVFGFFGLTSHDSLFSICVSATIPGGMPCASTMDDHAMSLLHAKIFQSFSNAVISLALLMLLALAIRLVESLKIETLSLSGISIRNDESVVTSSALKVSDWLKLYQQHPGRINQA